MLLHMENRPKEKVQAAFSGECRDLSRWCKVCCLAGKQSSSLPVSRVSASLSPAADER